MPISLPEAGGVLEMYAGHWVQAQGHLRRRFARRHFGPGGPRLAGLGLFVAAIEVQPQTAAARPVADVGRFALRARIQREKERET